MTMAQRQDPNVMPWGALDRYQAHYIVSMPQEDDRRGGTGRGADVFAKTRLATSGRFAAKKVRSVSWEGASHPLLDRLNGDGELNDMIARRSVWDASIYIEQTGTEIRIHGRWKDSATFGVDSETFEVYDRIAGHVRASCLPPV